MPGFEGYEFRSEDMERVKEAAKRMKYETPGKLVRGEDWRDGLSQYSKPKMEHNIDMKYNHSKIFDEYNVMYAKDGDHVKNNTNEVLKKMVVEGGDVSKSDEFDPLSLEGVSHIPDVEVEVEAARDNKMGAPMNGYKRLDWSQEKEVAYCVDDLDARKIGGGDIGYYAQYQGLYQAGWKRNNWLDDAVRRTSPLDTPGNVVENEHVQLAWLSNSKTYDPELAWAGPNMRGAPRYI